MNGPWLPQEWLQALRSAEVQLRETEGDGPRQLMVPDDLDRGMWTWVVTVLLHRGWTAAVDQGEGIWFYPPGALPLHVSDIVQRNLN